MNDVVAYLVGVVVLVLGLAASIALHEVGHLVPAKRYGVKVTQYMIGFGPTLFSRRRGETEYGLKAVPLGGYIRMIGMYAPERTGAPASTGRFAQLSDDARRAAAEEIGPGEDHRTFYRLPVRRRLVVMLGGPLMNLLLATALLAVMLSGIGVPAPQGGAVVSSVSECVVPAGVARTECGPTDPRTPAFEAGLRPGDELVAVAGVPVTGADSVGELVRPRTGQPTEITLDRDGEPLVVRVTPIRNTVVRTDDAGQPVLDAAGDPLTVDAGFLGVTSGPRLALERQPLSEVPAFVAEATWRTAGIVINLPARMVGVAQAAFGGGERDPNGPIGVVGVGRLSGEVASSDLLTSTAERVGTMLGILGSVNLALFVFNLVPLLPLDGGHVAGALYEGARRSLARRRGRPDPGPFDLARLLPVTYAVVALFLAMSVLLLYADIVNPVTLG